MDYREMTIATPYLTANRGNAMTAKRLKTGFEKNGIKVDLIAFEELKERKVPVDILQNKPVIALHAYRFASFVRQHRLSLPGSLLVVMTGTDHNHDLYDDERRKVMEPILDAAQYIVLFHQGAAEQVRSVLPKLTEKVRIIPQGILLPKRPTQLSEATDKLLKSKKASDVVFLLPTGLREVKNVFFSIPLLAKLKKRHPGIRLWIVGPVIEKQVYDKVKSVKESWVYYGGEIPFNEMGMVYEAADVVINTSISEGQASSILEAMAYGKPVIANDIPGNRNTIVHGKTGLLYRTEKDFLHLANLLITDDVLKEQIVAHAKEYIQKAHDPDQEVLAYLNLLHRQM